MDSTGPAVSVVTPFYNTADYLGECIESVLDQTFEDFEYILADNASTDGSAEIARRYAAQDRRVRYVRFDELLPQVPNYNRALREADPGARYCKVAQADDLLLPQCLEAMVRFGDEHPEASLIGAYTVLQDEVFLDGLDFYETVVDGDDICRRYFDDGPYLLGNPTTHMYRMEDVTASFDFYDVDIPFEDADKAMELIVGRDFGFVHQVLTFVRTSNDSISTRLREYYVDAVTRRCLLERYGSRVFETDDLDQRRQRLARRHYRILGEGLLLRRPHRFWKLHVDDAAGAGVQVTRTGIIIGAAITLVRWLVNPEDSLRRLWHWVTS